MVIKITNEPIAIIADIHSNFEALNVVLRDIQRRGIRRTYNLGDIVGYGPNPKECLDIVMNSQIDGIAGNHDAGASSYAISKEPFNEEAQKALEWTRAEIERGQNSEKYWHFLRYLDDRITMNYNGTLFQMYHGSPLSPLFHYVRTWEMAYRDLTSEGAAIIEQGPEIGLPIESLYEQDATLDDDRIDLSEPEGGTEANIIRMVDGLLIADRTDLFSKIEHICFVGHNHRAVVIEEYQEDAYEEFKPEDIDHTYYLHDAKAIICVGSVGQSRDIVGKATYVVVDGKKVEFVRLPYDIQSVRDKILEKRIGTDLTLYDKKE